jgi:hypothetical protein
VVKGWAVANWFLRSRSSSSRLWACVVTIGFFEY